MMQANTHNVIFTDQDFMAQAMELAAQAAQIGEVPVGALVVHEGEIERGKTSPTLITIDRIAKALNCSIAELMDDNLSH